MRRNTMGRIVGGAWRVAICGRGEPKVDFATLVTEPRSKPLRTGDRVSLRACRLGLIRALNTYPIDDGLSYARYLGWIYTVECLEGDDVGRTYDVPAPLIGRVFTTRSKLRS